jgi:L-iditol 2-dehydrogenase
MRSASIWGAHDVRVEEANQPSTGPGEELVRVTAVGICGSDLHWFEEGGVGDARLSAPKVLGHEFAGLTAAGERVAVDPAIPCGHCELCRRGHDNLCEAVRFAGHDIDGAFRDWIAWPRANFHRLPDSLSDADGAMLEPLGVAIHACRLAHLQPGCTVGVFGCGPIGWLVAQLAQHLGASRVFATDLPTRPHRLDAGRVVGATMFAADGSEVRRMLEANGGKKLDVAIEAAGTNGAVDAAVEAVMPGARVVLAGIPAEERTSVNASAARRKGLTLAWSRRMAHTYPEAIELVGSGAIDVRSCVTHTFPLERIADAFTSASNREGMKVVVTCA